MAMPYPVGRHRFVLGGMPFDVSIVPPEQCASRMPTGLSIVGPDPTRVRGGHPLWWAVVGGTELLCCAEPASVVTHRMAADRAIELSLASCALDPCECVGTPRSYHAWHLLGELPSGEHVVRAGGFEQRFSVP
jgi:hypothetical protein